MDTKIKVKFDGIKINTERQLFEGKLVTSYDKTEQNVFEVPIIKSIESAIKAIEKIFKNQKDITQKQKRLEKQLADNKIDKEKYKQESEKIKEEIAQNDKSLDAVSQYIKETPTLTEADKENTINQVNSFKSSGSKQSFDESKADKLLTVFKNFKKRETEYHIADYQVKFDKDIDNQPYKFYLSPAGRVVILPSEAVPLFDKKIEGYGNLNIPEGALTGFILDNKKYESEFIKKDGKWWFNGYVACKEKREDKTCKRGAYYNDINGKLRSIEERIASKDESILKELRISDFASIPLIVGGTIAMEGIATQGTLRAGGSVWLRARTLYKLSIVTLVWELFVTPSYVETVGTGAVISTLPIDLNSATTNEPYVINPPKVLPITIPHKLPNSSGDCNVYVIWKTSLSDNGIVKIAKYGMTCQDNFPTKPDCNPRPEYQVNEFNSQKDGYKYNYSWIVKNVSKELAHILEKSMTAVYVIENEGNLPSHHYLPCFTRKNDFEKRKDRAEKWIEEMIRKYGK